MRRLLLLALLVPASAGDILENGGIGKGDGWNHTPGAPSVTFEVDRKEGAKRDGCLSIANTDAEDDAAHNWFARFDVPRGAPYRLKLTVQAKTEGLAEGAEANVMVQIYPAKGNAVGYAWCGAVTKDQEWGEIKAVFDVPKEAAYVRILAYFVGKGHVLYDDFSVTKTEEPVTPPPPSKPRRVKDDPLWKLVRSAAEEIPWMFDAAAARALAAKEKRPLLLYVRCVDDRDAFESARTTLRANAVNSYDDGLKKDILFRAGPLSDPAVSELITRRFVPLLLTYHLGVHGVAGGSLSPWYGDGGGDGSTVEIDADEGAHEKGSLFIRNTVNGPLHQWSQSIDAPAERPCKVRMEAAFRTKGFAKGSEACVMVQCRAADGTVPAYARIQEVRQDRDWKRDDVEFEVPAACTQIVLIAYLKGEGEVWFDDIRIERVAGKDRENLIRSGGIDPREGVDPLREFGLRATEVVTPALVVVDGKSTRKLHRIGTMSTDLVDEWLRGSLDAPSRASDPEEQLADGDLDKAALKGGVVRARALLRRGDLDGAERAIGKTKSSEAALVRGMIALRRDAGADALGAFIDAQVLYDEEQGDAKGPGLLEARFWAAWSLRVIGKQELAESQWKEIAGPTRFGRRAAACVLPNGPRLWLSMTERLWPRGRALPEQTEGYGDAFDGAESVRALLELQNGDGSFGGHDGAPGQGFNDGAITALASEALALWSRHVPKALGADASRERALDWLEQWSRRENGPTDAFNNPYVLMELLRARREGASGAVIARIAQNQLEDGNWTVYQAARPASFNTALNVLALARAKEAGVKVPADVLDRGVKALAAMRQKDDLFPYSTMTGHEWMTTEHGSIARDALCEHALLENGKGDATKLKAALGRFEKFAPELRLPTKKLYDYFNSRGHGGYYFFFAHRNAFDAAALLDGKTRDHVRELVRKAVLDAREGDGTFMDHQMIGRAYATAQALSILAPR